MKIKTTCPTKLGGCGREHFLEVPDDLDEEFRGQALTFAQMTGCPSCSIWQESRYSLDKVRQQNQRTIWEQERRREYLENILKAKPRNSTEIEGKIRGINAVIKVAREDLVEAVGQIARLDDARAEQLGELDFA